MTDEKTPFDKNMEMWERWTASYMDTMAKAVDRTMEQSAVLRQQVEKAAAVAVNTQLETALTAIRSLEKQMETLSGRIEELLQKRS